MKLKQSITIVLLLSLCLFLVGCKKGSEIVGQTSKVAAVTQKIKKEKIPTVFIHGYSGNNNTMKSMTNRFEKSNHAKNVMEMTVSSEGEVSISGNKKVTFEANNPMIRLAYDENKTHQWDQASWLKEALAVLKKDYGVEEVNLVGFSMGGISSFLYLESYPSDQTQPKVNKVVSIGAPFNEFIEDKEQTREDIEANGPRQISPQLTNYQELVTNLDPELKFLLIAGQISENDKSDGTVPLNSSLGIYALLKEKKIEVQSEVIYGVNADHSSLRKNEEVDDYVAEFLWQ